jgi:rsbT co-antagonist protein RsbR
MTKRDSPGTRPADRRVAIVALVRAMGLDEADIAERLKAADLDDDDRARLRSLQAILDAHADEEAARFIQYLWGGGGPAPPGSDAVLDEVKALKRQHIVAMGQGTYGMDYALQRIELSYLYGALGFEVKWVLGAYHRLLRTIAAALADEHRDDPGEAFRTNLSLQKLASFDIALIVDTLVVQRERTIQVQQEAIRELSTPVLQVRPGLLVMPVIGVLDTQRAFQLTEQLLRSIRSNRARVVVLDITGVAGLDSKVANHLVQTVEAARLMGAVTIVSGVSPEVAQAIVTIGVELGRVNTVGDLQRGLEESERLLGYKIVMLDDDARRAQRV